MKHGCRECWDPVDRDGAELCDWCAMTPEQRQKRASRANVIAIVVLVAYLLLIFFLASGRIPSWS